MWPILLAKLPTVDGEIDAEEEGRRKEVAEVGAKRDAEEHPNGVVGVNGAND